MIEIGVGEEREAIVQVVYPSFTDLRWRAYLQLDLEAMDGVLALLIEEWAEVYNAESEASLAVRGFQEDLQTLEASIHIAIEDEIVGKSAAERDALRKSLTQGKFEWQETNGKLLAAKDTRDKLATKLGELDKRLGVLQGRIAWRRQTVALLTRLPEKVDEDDDDKDDDPGDLVL